MKTTFLKYKTSILTIVTYLTILIPNVSTASGLLESGNTDKAVPMAINATTTDLCERLKTLSLENTVIDSASVVPTSSVSAGYGAPETQVPATCRVHATVSHPGANDRIGIDVWMPIDSWNGRFVGVGGRVYGGGNPNALGGLVRDGYTAATTDTGHSSMFSGSFVLDENNRLDWKMVRNFSYVGVHDLAVVEKSVIAEFYGNAPKYSYWNGCSTGGRQGLEEAQRYPQDFDGILLSSPGVSSPRIIMAEFWPQLVMIEEKNFMPQYLSLFVLGILAYRWSFLESITKPRNILWLIPGIGIYLLIIILLFSSGPKVAFYNAEYSEALLCVGVCIGLLALFRKYFNKTGTIMKTMSDNIFGMYIFHVPVVVALQYAFDPVKASALTLFIIVSVLSIPGTFFVSYVVRLIPGMKRII